MQKGKPLTVRCPQCGRNTAIEENPYRPFCSRRCKLIDLGRWVDEEYVIPGENADGKKETETE